MLCHKELQHAWKEDLNETNVLNTICLGINMSRNAESKPYLHHLADLDLCTEPQFFYKKIRQGWAVPKLECQSKFEKSTFSSTLGMTISMEDTNNLTYQT